VKIDNGEDSIKAVKEKHYDLVLMDVHLPGINGTIATQRIREFDSRIPIIALTAISLDENREMLLWDERCDNKTICPRRVLHWLIT
jgi:CheY-like chemotaxis protein